MPKHDLIDVRSEAAMCVMAALGFLAILASFLTLLLAIVRLHISIDFSFSDLVLPSRLFLIGTVTLIGTTFVPFLRMRGESSVWTRKHWQLWPVALVIMIEVGCLEALLIKVIVAGIDLLPSPLASADQFILTTGMIMWWAFLLGALLYCLARVASLLRKRLAA